jgi:hypothetical protein
MNLPLPNFLVVGAQKSGTTALAHSLGAHPDIFLPEAKEAHHFGTVADEKLGSPAYRQFFREWRGERLIGEATPNYFTLPEAPRQIARILPGVKLILILRNPVDRAYSAYWHAVREGAVKTGFDELICDMEKLSRRPWWSGIVRDGVYHRYLERYRSHFSADQICLILHDDLRADPASALEPVAQFLSLSGPLLQATPRRNPAARSRLPFALRKWAFQRLPTLHDKSLVPFTPPAMSAEARARLSAYFRPENEKLGAMIDRDLAFWG